MSETETPPNIVFIMLDATRVDRLSCYGNRAIITPNIDRIAEQSVLYENAFSPDVWTLPVITSIFTGLLPGEHGVDYTNPILSRTDLTLASLLKQQGYETRAISAGSWISEATGLDQGFSEFVEAFRLTRRWSSSALVQLLNRLYTKHVYWREDKGAKANTRILQRWLQKRQNSGSSQPFFLFLHYLEPHYPYLAPAPYTDLYISNKKELERAKRISYHPLDFFADNIQLTIDEFELLNRLYDAEITYVDLFVGQVYDTLQAFGLIDNTVLVIFADHGENIGDHQLIDHHFCLYDTLLHVPLLIRYPEEFPPGTRVEELVETIDLYSTVLRLAGCRTAQDPSHSLLPTDLRINNRGHVRAQTSGEFFKAIRRRHPSVSNSSFERVLWAIRTCQWKYIEGSDGVVELYDLKSDPGEANNIIRSASDELLTELKKYMAQFRSHQASEQSNKNGGSEEIFLNDPSTLERLRALGYLE